MVLERVDKKTVLLGGGNFNRKVEREGEYLRLPLREKESRAANGRGEKCGKSAKTEERNAPKQRREMR